MYRLINQFLMGHRRKSEALPPDTFREVPKLLYYTTDSFPAV